MATLSRLFNFTANTPIVSAQVNAEFNQIVNLLNGTTTGVNAIMRFSDPATPPLQTDQTGAGAIQQWLQAGIVKSSVNNAGSLLVNTTIALGTNNRLAVNHVAAPQIDVATSLRAPTGVRPLDIVAADNTAPSLFRAFDDGDIAATRAAKFQVLQRGQVQSRLVFYSTETGDLINHGGVVKTIIADTANSGTAETDLHTYTFPANTFGATGDTFEFECAVLLATNANSKTIRVYFAGTAFLTLTTTDSNQRAIIRGHLMRASNGTQMRTCAVLVYGTGASPVASTQLDLINVTFTGTNIFKVTGQGAASSDLTQTTTILKFWPNT